MTWTTNRQQETECYGEHLASLLRPGDVVALCGPLGAGKTAFTRGIIRALFGEEVVTSPTFAIANEYTSEKGTLVHCDLYRLSSEEELFETGFYDYLDGKRIVVMEWPDQIPSLLDEATITVYFEKGEGDQRTLSVSIPER